MIIGRTAFFIEFEIFPEVFGDFFLRVTKNCDENISSLIHRTNTVQANISGYRTLNEKRATLRRQAPRVRHVAVFTANSVILGFLPILGVTKINSDLAEVTNTSKLVMPLVDFTLR